MTLSDTVSGWTAYGFSIKQAVHDLIALHLARQNAKGSGNKARRRAQAIHSLHTVWMDTVNARAKVYDFESWRWVELPPLNLTHPPTTENGPKI